MRKAPSFSAPGQKAPFAIFEPQIWRRSRLLIIYNHFSTITQPFFEVLATCQPGMSLLFGEYFLFIFRVNRPITL